MSISDDEVEAAHRIIWPATEWNDGEHACREIVRAALTAAAKVRANSEGDGEATAAALAAGQKAAMESNGCGLTYMGLRHFCDHPYLPDEMRSSHCACKTDAEAAIRAYVSALAAATGGEKV